MSKIILLLNIMISSLSWANGVLIKAQLDPQEITLPEGYKFWSQQETEAITSRPLRDEIMSSSTLFLQGQIKMSDFSQLLQEWSEKGFNSQERMVLIDTLQKSKLPLTIKNRWLCRLDLERNCPRVKIFTKHLAPILQKYEWLIIDGKAYPRVSWNEISIVDEPLTWVFLSSRFETYIFKGHWDDLKLRNPNLKDWVTGDCSQYTVAASVQSIENQVLLSSHCLKPSLVIAKQESTFYERNKKTIWITAGALLGLGAFQTFSGKNIVIEKPSFR